MTLVEVIDRLIDQKWLDDNAKALLLQLRADVNVDTIARVLAAIHRDKYDLEKIGRALDAEYPDQLLGAMLPGSAFARDVDVRLYRTWEKTTDWHGDILIQPGTGTSVTVATPRGARALGELSREVRAGIMDLKLMSIDDANAMAVLAELPFDGVRSLDTGSWSPSHVAELILRCGELATYVGAVTTREVTDALATTAVCDVHAWNADDNALDGLAHASHLEVLGLFHHSAAASGARFSIAGLRGLARFPRLRSLDLAHCGVTDAEVAAVATLERIEKLFIAGNPFLDEGGVRLGDMHALRTLDLHEVLIGDATVVALAELPQLAELDLAETSVGVLAMRALKRARSLKRLGLAKYVRDDVVAVAKELRGVKVELTRRRGGALWGT